MEDTGYVLTHRGVERQGAYQAYSNNKPKIYRTYTRKKKERERGKGIQKQYSESHQHIPEESN